MKIAYELAVYREDFKVAFKSESLNEQVRALRTAHNAGNKALWMTATAVYNIFEKELFAGEDMFNTEQDFAKFIGVSTAQISAYKNAVKFALSHEDLYTRDNSGNINGGLTVSKSDILQRIDKVDEFDTWCVDNYHCHVWQLGDNSIKKLLNVFNKPVLEDKQDKQDTEQNTEQDTEQEKKQDTEQDTEQEEKTTCVSITDSNGYVAKFENIPISILNQAMDLLKEYRTETLSPDGEQITA